MTFLMSPISFRNENRGQIIVINGSGGDVSSYWGNDIGGVQFRRIMLGKIKMRLDFE